MPDSPFHLFGIRHHGPGCARSLVSALERLAPDCILLEGPVEAEPLLPYLSDPQLQPPLALLISAADEPQRAAFYPFATFSPEWQAMQYAQRQGVPLRFMDLPVANSLALSTTAATTATVAEEESPALPEEDSAAARHVRQDPLDWLGRAAGYDSGESWWNRLVEERQDHLELFDAIAEAMATVRAASPAATGAYGYREQLREAAMRRTMRQAQKEGYQRIAVICGAWHLSALSSLPAARADNELLKGLEKIKTQCTWVPWSYSHLSEQSGYAAGVLSPQWYEYIWHYPEPQERATRWLATAARLLREHQLDCSSAQVIDALRLANSLAGMRGYAHAGLEELLEALQACVCMGETAPLALIREQLVIGQQLGSIPASVPSIPLQQDIERWQKRLRLKAEVAHKVLDLDLRKDNDLARSHLLHRLNILGIGWGSLQGQGQSGKGSFHEVWGLQWDPHFALTIITVSHWGSTLEQAAAARLVSGVTEGIALAELASRLQQALLADLAEAIAPLTQALADSASLSADAAELMRTIEPLVRIARYGNVRNTRSELVEQVLHSLIPRAALALPGSCKALDDEAAHRHGDIVAQAHQAILLLANDSLSEYWWQALQQLAMADSDHGYLSGLACNLLQGQQWSADQTRHYLGRALSAGVAVSQAAAWLEGFLHQGGMVLLHDDALWQLVNEWLLSLSEEHFLHVLPLVRRRLSEFSPHERRQLAERARHGAPRQPSSLQLELDQQRAALTLPLLRQLLGVAS
ncbi:hypothetical protein C4K68_02620 [Pokkaliibacter plantistimulans]|uniref:4-aminobutyrate aminotransferase n=1 Tax=Proteobacteria bacterium 228 TaxID=2083153 RepID=A0A2S5KVP0_9PROT|nr:DUF5682 family protein [Pokkaliibacter plantistimulans]PPC78914.1 hypothetical protein C4K68_02620 [Pokkaliibacter plantistimulans]